MRNIALLVLLLATGCANHPSSGPLAAFTVDIQPAVAGEINTISVHDNAANSATLQADLRMGDMEMPPMHVTLQRGAGGQYVANDVEFSMSGNWTLRIADNVKHESTFKVR